MPAVTSSVDLVMASSPQHHRSALYLCEDVYGTNIAQLNGDQKSIQICLRREALHQFQSTQNTTKVGLIQRIMTVPCQLSLKHHAADVYSSQRRYPLRHSISGRQPSAIMLRPELEKAKCFGAAASSQRSHAHHHYDAASPPFTTVHYGNSRGSISDVDFISPPTIPKPHVPHSVLKRQVRRAGAGLHNPRVMTVNTGRDAIKLAQWNDISA
jgi:hypothetical protein